MSLHLTTRQVNFIDWPKIEAAFNHTFKTTRTPECWRWRYQSNHLNHDSSNILCSSSVCLSDSGNVVAFAGGNTHRALFFKNHIEVIIGADNFSVPQLHKNISKGSSSLIRVIDEFHKNNINKYSVAVGFAPQRRSKLGVILSYEHIFKNSSWFSLEIKSVLNSIGSKCIVTRADFSNIHWDIFWERRKSLVQSAILRDQNFLNWRFNSKYGNTYWKFAVNTADSDVPLGYVVVTPRSDEVAVIVDCAFTNDFPIIRDALQKINNWLYYKGIRRVETFSTPGCPEFEVWSILGFNPFEATFGVLPIFRVYNKDISNNDFQDSFAMTLADGDLF